MLCTGPIAYNQIAAECHQACHQKTADCIASEAHAVWQGSVLDSVPGETAFLDGVPVNRQVIAKHRAQQMDHHAADIGYQQYHILTVCRHEHGVCLLEMLSLR